MRASSRAAKVEITKGHTYRAKLPRNTKGFFNDRRVVLISHTLHYTYVTYESPACRTAASRQTVLLERFERWAGKDVTNKLPYGTWEIWNEHE